MYERYWQFERAPFGQEGDAACFFTGESHQSALLKLRYVVAHRKGAALLVGATGLGKTHLVNQLAHDLGEAEGPVVRLLFPQLSPIELLGYLSAKLGADEGRGDDAVPLDLTLRRLEARLEALTRQGRHPVLIVEDAHLIEDRRVFQTFQLLLNLQQSGRIGFTLILVGQRSLASRLQRMPELNERIALRCVLQPLSREETADYVHKHLEAAGGQPGIFDDGALAALYEVTGGVPRRIDRLCDVALLVGCADGLSMIRKEQIEELSREITGAAA